MKDKFEGRLLAAKLMLTQDGYIFIRATTNPDPSKCLSLLGNEPSSHTTTLLNVDSDRHPQCTLTLPFYVPKSESANKPPSNVVQLLFGSKQVTWVVRMKGGGRYTPIKVEPFHKNLFDRETSNTKEIKLRNSNLNPLQLFIDTSAYDRLDVLKAYVKSGKHFGNIILWDGNNIEKITLNEANRAVEATTIKSFAVKVSPNSKNRALNASFEKDRQSQNNIRSTSGILKYFGKKENDERKSPNRSQASPKRRRSQDSSKANNNLPDNSSPSNLPLKRNMMNYESPKKSQYSQDQNPLSPIVAKTHSVSPSLSAPSQSPEIYSSSEASSQRQQHILAEYRVLSKNHQAILAQDETLISSYVVQLTFTNNGNHEQALCERLSFNALLTVFKHCIKQSNDLKSIYDRLSALANSPNLTEKALFDHIKKLQSLVRVDVDRQNNFLESLRATAKAYKSDLHVLNLHFSEDGQEQASEERCKSHLNDYFQLALENNVDAYELRMCIQSAAEVLQTLPQKNSSEMTSAERYKVTRQIQIAVEDKLEAIKPSRPILAM